MAWNQSDIDAALARNPSLRAANSHQAQGPIPERAVPDGPVAATVREEGDRSRIRVIIESRRVRLLDEDNLCGKYFVDLLRYAGVLPTDAPGVVGIKIFQTRVSSKEEEETVVEVFPAGLVSEET